MARSRGTVSPTPRVAASGPQERGAAMRGSQSKAAPAAGRASYGAERYERYQREVRSGRVNSREGPRPLEFDENGLPLPQRSPGFVERVSRLLNPL